MGYLPSYNIKYTLFRNKMLFYKTKNKIKINIYIYKDKVLKKLKTYLTKQKPTMKKIQS